MSSSDSTAGTDTGTDTHTTRPARRPLRRVAATVGVVALAAPFALGIAALGSTAPFSTVSAGESLTAEPGVVATTDRDDFRPPRGAFGGPGRSGDGVEVPGTTGLATDTVDATAEQSVGVVLISNTADYGDGEAAGTGLVLSSDGLVVTNHHVVADGTTLEVTLAGGAEAGETFEATYVGGDATRDIAVLQLVGATGLTPVGLDDDGVSAGETVTAVGDAGGDGGSLTAAEGIVTDVRTGIDVSNDDGTTSRLRALIEVDADIVPGDSGGALLDADGEVVGMNVAASSGGRNIIGYAIPVSRVLRIADAIVDGDQSADHSDISLGYGAFLGVELADSSTTLAGVLDGTAATDAGLAAGDTVTAVGEVAVASADELSSALAAHDSLTISWTTAAGEQQQADVVLGNAPIA